MEGIEGKHGLIENTGTNLVRERYVMWVVGGELCYFKTWNTTLGIWDIRSNTWVRV